MKAFSDRLQSWSQGGDDPHHRQHTLRDVPTTTPFDWEYLAGQLAERYTIKLAEDEINTERTGHTAFHTTLDKTQRPHTIDIRNAIVPATATHHECKESDALDGESF
jgi:hypothetical protein